LKKGKVLKYFETKKIAPFFKWRDFSSLDRQKDFFILGKLKYLPFTKQPKSQKA